MRGKGLGEGAQRRKGSLDERGAQGEDGRSVEGTEAREGLGGWLGLASSFSGGWVGTWPQSQIRGWW